MNDILLHIVGYQEIGDDIEGIEFTTAGKLEEREGELSIFYEDTQLIEGYSTMTNIIVKKDSIMLIKTGAVETQFVFELQKTFAATYATPFGRLELVIYPTLMDSKADGNGGKIELEYVANFSGSQAVNRLDVSYFKDSPAVRS